MTSSYETEQNISGLRQVWRFPGATAGPLGQRGIIRLAWVALCRASILPEWPVSIVPFGLFCHSGPVLGKIKQIIQCFRMRSDFRHLQAIPSSKPIFLRRIHRHRESPCLCEPRCLAHVTTSRLWLFPVPTKNINGNVLQNWSIAKIYVSSQIVETTHTKGRQSAGGLSVCRISGLLWVDFPDSWRRSRGAPLLYLLPCLEPGLNTRMHMGCGQDACCTAHAPIDD
jgi:hypothetical protein